MSEQVEESRLVQVEIENFKSYGGKHIVGPFFDFSCIVGPNGSGKSNIVDAVCFALGAPPRDLRVDHIEDLVYRSKDDTPASSASVALLMKDGGEDMLLSRRVTNSGNSQYAIGGNVVPFSTYRGKLESWNLSWKTRSFLVPQHEVSRLAEKKPKDITAMFEQLSGSTEFKREYEEAESLCQGAREQFLSIHQKKKGVLAEKHEYSRQREEVEQYETHQRELIAAKKEQVLFRLFHIEKQVRNNKSLLEAENSNLEELEKTESTAKEKVTQKKKERAKFHKDHLRKERDLKNTSDKWNEIKMNLIKCQEEMRHTKHRLESHEVESQNAGKESEIQKKEITKLHSDLSTANERKDDWVKSFEEEDELKLNARQQAEYDSLEQQAREKTVTLRQELEGISRKQKGDAAALNGVEDRISMINYDKQNAMERRVHLEERISQQEGELSEFIVRQSEISERIRDVEKKKTECNSKMRESREQLTSVETHLMELKADRRESQREKRMREAVEYMMNHFKGVLGRLSDLVVIPQRKYRLAAALAMGRYFDAVVVEDVRVAKECLKYLKDTRAGLATFLPLDSIQVKPVRERLRTLGSTLRLAVDVIQYEPQVEKAVMFACGNSVICDTLEEAREFAYRGRQDAGLRLRICTTDGTLISKNGNISGGLASFERSQQVRRWDAKEQELLKTKRDNYRRTISNMERTLMDLPSVQELKSQLHLQVSGAKACRTHLNLLKKKLKDVDLEIRELEKNMRPLIPERDSINVAMEERASEVSDLTRKISVVRKVVFEDLSKSLNVANISEYEEKRLKRQEEYNKKIHEFDSLIAKLENMIDYNSKHDKEEDLRRAVELVEDEKKRLEMLESDEQNILSEFETISHEVEELRKANEQLKKEVSDKEIEIREVIGFDRGRQREIGSHRKEASKLEQIIERLRSERHSMYESCRLDDLSLPVTEPEASATRDRKRRRGASGVQMSAETDDADIVFSEAFSISQSVGTADTQQRRERDEMIQIDFSALPDRLKEDRDTVGVHKVEHEYDERIRTLTAKKDRLAPNMKAIEQLRDATSRLNTSKKELEDAKEVQSKRIERFDVVKRDRTRRFMSAFEKVQASVDAIYKELTRDEKSPFGGTAYLSLENPEEPYLGGIKYNCTPPGKRITDQLSIRSGGERTVSALALLFAIQDFQPTPFFLFDEIDMSLDNVNVGKVVTYIKKYSTKKQCIVISHKDKFFEHADSLIGICRDEELDRSRILTLDMSSYT